MKQLKSIWMVWGILSISVMQLHAQETSTNLISKQDSIQTRLWQYQQQLTSFPQNDACSRTGYGVFPISRDTMMASELKNGLILENQQTDNLSKGTGDVNIYWIHGLNGNTDTWKIAALCTEFGCKSQDFPAYQARSHNFGGNGNGMQSYSENFGISLAAADYATLADRNILPTNRTPRDFIIAHSQGGIVAREWLRKIDKEPLSFPNYAHGLVTFGTPHGGAQIINQTRSDLLNKTKGFMNEACVQLSRAAVKDLTKNTFVTKLPYVDELISGMVSKACDGVSGTIIPMVLENYMKRTTKDYYVGSPFLTGTKDNNGQVIEQGLTDYTLKVPFVQFYGVEQEPVLWRFMSSVQHMGEDKLSNNQLIFGYDNDEALMQKVNDLYNYYQNMTNWNQQEYDYWKHKDCMFDNVGTYLLNIASVGTLYIECLALKEYKMKTYRELITAFGGAAKWLRNANDYYKVDILGTRYVAKTEYKCTSYIGERCTKNGVQPEQTTIQKVQNTFMVDKPENCPCTNEVKFYNKNQSPDSYRCISVKNISLAYVNTYANKPSDGVVLAESAAANLNYDPNATNMSVYRVVLPKTNHSQMLNCSLTRTELKNLYKGVYGKLFEIRPR